MRLYYLAAASAASLTLAACVDLNGRNDRVWQLASLDGAAFTAPATLKLDASGNLVSGSAPCNTWSGRVVTDPFPAWAIREVTKTEKACSEMAAEKEFFAGLARATHMAVSTESLTLSDLTGYTMEFRPAE